MAMSRESESSSLPANRFISTKRQLWCRVAHRMSQVLGASFECTISLQADDGHVTDKTMQLINNLNFLSYKQRAGGEPTKSSIKASTKRTSKDVSRSGLKATFSEIQNNGPKPDQAFADDIAAALQRFSPEQKYVLKAKFWQVLAEFGNRV